MVDKSSVAGRPLSGRPAETAGTGGAGSGGSARGWLVLIVVALGVIVAMAGNLALNPALGAIRSELEAGATELRWMVDAYLLALAAFMLAAGALGDVAGGKKLYLAGLVLFTGASLAGGLSESAWMLVAARAVQGLGAAMLVPASLALLVAAFPAGRRGSALGIWAALAASAVAAGPLAGAYMVQNHSWQMIFYAGVPVGLVGLLLAALAVKESRDASRPPGAGPAGMLLGTAGVLLLAYALLNGGAEGWGAPRVLGALGVAALLLALFALAEAKGKNPLMPKGLLRNRSFLGSSLVGAAVFFSLFGAAVFVSRYLLDVRGYSPEDAALRLLPLVAAVLVVSPLAGKLADRHGARWLLALGCLYAAGGLALLLRLDPASSYESIILPALVVLGAGLGLTLAPTITGAMDATTARRAGAASGAANTARQVGGVLGLALMGGLATAAYRDGLPDVLTGAGLDTAGARSAADRVPDNLATAGSALEGLREQLPAGTPDSVVARALAAAQDTFVDAIGSGFLAAAAFMLVAALLAAILIRSREDQVAVEAVPEPATEEDHLRKSKKRPESGTGVVIDARTEQVLREALEPSTLAPAAAAAPEPAAAPAPPAAPAVPEKPRRGALKPVSVAEAHYHQDPAAPEPDDEWRPEPEAGGADLTADSYQHLRSLMVDLPIKAGTGEVERNLEEVALATLRYYQYGLSQPGGDTLPVGVTNGAQSSIREDIAILAGYLDLEKRFGRVDQSLATEQAAAHLMAAVGSRALETGAAGASGNEAFIRETVAGCLRGMAPAAAPEPAGSAPGGGPEPTRLVYRRKGPAPGSGT